MKGFAKSCSDSSSRKKGGVSKVVLELESDVPRPVLIERGLPAGRGSRNKYFRKGKLIVEDY